jgi:hypothetical protein
VRGAVVVTGFIFLAVGLGLFALSAVFRSQAGSVIASSAIGGAVAGRFARQPAHDNADQDNVPVEVTRLERVEAEPLALPKPETQEIEVMSGAPQIANSWSDFHEALDAFPWPSRSVPEKERENQSIFREMESQMEHYREFSERNPVTDMPGYIAANKRPKKRETVELATATEISASGHAKKGVFDFLGESILTEKGRRKVAQGWNDYVGLHKASAKTAREAARREAGEEAMRKARGKKQPAAPAFERLTEFGQFKVGGTVYLKPAATGIGRARTDEPLEITEIFRDAKGVGIGVKGASSGKGMFPAEELEVKVDKRQKQRALLTKLGVLRDWTKPKPKK